MPNENPPNYFEVRNISRSVFRREVKKSLKWWIAVTKLALGSATAIAVVSAFTAVFGTAWQLWGLRASVEQAVKSDLQTWVQSEVKAHIPGAITENVAETTMSAANSAAKANATIESLNMNVDLVKVQLDEIRKDREELLKELSFARTQIEESKNALKAVAEEVQNARTKIEEAASAIDVLKNEDASKKLLDLAKVLEEPEVDALARLGELEKTFSEIVLTDGPRPGVRLKVDSLEVTHSMLCSGESHLKDVFVRGAIASEGFIRVGAGNSHAMISPDEISLYYGHTPHRTSPMVAMVFEYGKNEDGHPTDEIVGGEVITPSARIVPDR